MRSTDLIIIGGGIVGLATAYQYAIRQPGRSLMILEKEPQLARHQTGRNSGVLHSGIYYKPGSLKARNCRGGLQMMIDFCQHEDVVHEICGKVIVATDESELPGLQKLYERGRIHGLRCELIEAGRLKELEPHAAGIRALHVPETGIVDYTQVCSRLAERIRSLGHRIVTGAEVNGLDERSAEIVVQSAAGDFSGKYVVNCAGLYCDRISSLAGERPPVQILPFRGEYYELRENAPKVCRNLIYPVPDPRFPFLGVHLTRMISGGIHCGPNAVLALAREGYRKNDINCKDLGEMLTYPGFYRMAARHWMMGFEEVWRSFSKKAFTRALQRLVPEVREEDLVTSASGVRAQAVDRNGGLLDDFAIVERERLIHVLNAPSPAATSALSIGSFIAEKIVAKG